MFTLQPFSEHQVAEQQATYPSPTHINDALGEELARLAATINAQQYCFLVLLEEFDRRGGWNCGATRNCAHWLNWRCGISLGAARERLRVARALPLLPQISEAFAAGSISFSKARAMTRVATPETEGRLLNIARHGSASHVENVCRYFRRSLDAEALKEERIEACNHHDHRELTHHYDHEGFLVIKARLAPEQGALVVNALKAAANVENGDTDSTKSNTTDSDSTDAHTTDRESRNASQADALAIIAAHWINSPPTDAPTCNSDYTQVVLNVDINTLSQSGTCHDEAECSLNFERDISSDVARRLACDCSIVTMLMDGAEPMSVGRKTRVVPTAIRRGCSSVTDAVSSRDAAQIVFSMPTIFNIGPTAEKLRWTTWCYFVHTITEYCMRADTQPTAQVNL